MDKEIEIYDVVALTKDLPEQNLTSGQAGTVVLVHAPGWFEVEFIDSDDFTYTLPQEQLVLTWKADK